MDLRNYGMQFLCEEIGISPIGDYEIEYISARDLITADRIDLMAKIAYVKAKATGLNMKYAVELYKRNIEACTLGMFHERGNDRKQSFSDFISIFDGLISGIRLGGWITTAPLFQ